MLTLGPVVLTTTLLLATLWVHSTTAHSWIECLDTDRAVVFDAAKSYIYGGQGAAGKCQGYQRNYRGRGMGVQDEELMVKILKDKYTQSNVAVCKPGAAYDDQGFHKHIRVAPGQKVFFAYMPNGHVVVDRAARGTRYALYWTGQPHTELQYTSDLTPDHLLDNDFHDFDDGVCGQTYVNKTQGERSDRVGDDFPCVGEFSIPWGARPGVYSVVWMWKFWDEKNDAKEIVTVGGKYGGAAYSSCFDVEVTGDGPPSQPQPQPLPSPALRYESQPSPTLRYEPQPTTRWHEPQPSPRYDSQPPPRYEPGTVMPGFTEKAPWPATSHRPASWK